MCSKQSLSPWQTQTSFSSAKTSHTSWLEYGKDIGRQCILALPPPRA